MTTLRIPCAKAWFEKIKKGEPDLRPKRIVGKNFNTITFTLGYPKTDDTERHYVITKFAILEFDEYFVILTKTTTTLI